MSLNKAAKYPTWKDLPQWDGTFPRKIIIDPWEKWFAWYPVKLHGKRTWLKTLYRRKINKYVDMDDWAFYEYGTVFDILKD